MCVGQPGKSCVSGTKDMFSFEAHNFTILRLLVRNGADVNHPGDGNATALHFCTRIRYVILSMDLH